MKLIFTVLLFVLLGGTLLSQEEALVTDRPDQTESPLTVYPGAVQIESGVSFATQEYDEGENTQRLDQLALPNTLLRLGLTPWAELRVVTQPELQHRKINGESHRHHWGLADLQLGFKLNLTEDNSATQVGFLSHLLLPTGSDFLSNQKAGVINKLAVAHQLSERHSLSYNLGYDYLGYGSGDFLYSLSWGVALSPKLGVYLEGYGSWLDFSALEASADAGFTFQFQPHLQIDYSIGTGINHVMNYHALGLSLRLPR